MSSEVRIVYRAVDAATRVIRDIGDANKNLKQQFSAMRGEALAAGAVITAFALTVRQAYQFGKEGAEIERLRESGTRLAKGFGVDLAEAVAKIKEAARGTISNNQAVLQANRALMLGIAADTDIIANLVEIAVFRGRAAGLSAEVAFDRIVLGIGRLSTRILDDIGIVIDGETAYANYGAAIGKTADQLTEAQKRLALTNAIIAEGNTLIKESGGLVDDNAQAVEQFETNITDLGNAIRESFAEPLANVLDPLNKFLSLILATDEPFKQQVRDILANKGAYADYGAELNKAVINHAKLLYLQGLLTGDIEKQVEGLKILAGQVRFTEDDLSEMAGVMEDTRQTTDDTFGGESLADVLKWFEEFKKARDELVSGFGPGQIDFADLDKLAQQVLDFNTTLNEDFDPDAFLDQLGLLSEATVKFRQAIAEASSAASEAGAQITADEFLAAFFPIAEGDVKRKIEELEQELSDAIVELKRRRDEQLADLEQDFADDRIDDEIDLSRRLADIHDDRDVKIREVEEDSKKHIEDIEEDHQQRVQRIMEKYARQRLKAIIDRDARALFEAEVSRDEDLRDAERDRKRRIRDEEKHRRERIEQIEEEGEDRRAELLRQHEQERQDAQRDFDRKRRDIENDFRKRQALEEANFRKERDTLVRKLVELTGKMTIAYQQRITDRIRYWQTILQIDQLYQGIINGTNPGGGGSTDPVPAPPPPGGNPVPTSVVSPGTGPGPGMMRRGTSGSNVVVTLNVQGDGMLAQAVREASYTAIVDVMTTA